MNDTKEHEAGGTRPACTADLEAASPQTIMDLINPERRRRPTLETKKASRSSAPPEALRLLRGRTRSFEVEHWILRIVLFHCDLEEILIPDRDRRAEEVREKVQSYDDGGHIPHGEGRYLSSRILLALGKSRWGTWSGKEESVRQLAEFLRDETPIDVVPLERADEAIKEVCADVSS